MDQGYDPYSQARPDLQAVSRPLFEFAETQIQKRGTFLPFGVTLEPDGVARPGAQRVDQGDSQKRGYLPGVSSHLQLIRTALARAKGARPIVTDPRGGLTKSSNRVIGGVCAGIAEYMRVPALLVRVVFVAATPFWGAGLIVYGVLWLLLPPRWAR